MRRVNVRKRGKAYQYQFEIGTINGKRKFINKLGFKTQNEAYAAGQIGYKKYKNGGVKNVIFRLFELFDGERVD